MTLILIICSAVEVRSIFRKPGKLKNSSSSRTPDYISTKDLDKNT